MFFSQVDRSISGLRASDPTDVELSDLLELNIGQCEYHESLTALTFPCWNLCHLHQVYGLKVQRSMHAANGSKQP